ncbi:hypothetical protein D3C80_2032680 [compost metagenome]
MLLRPSVEIPARCSAAMDNGCTSPLGWLPALKAFIPAGAKWLKTASDRMLRQLLAVQRNRTFIGFSRQ